MLIRPLKLAAASAIALAVVATAIPAAGQTISATSPHYRSKGTAAAHWQASQLVKGRVSGAYGDDWGLTIDSAFAIAADGTQPLRLRRVTTAIANNYYAHYAVYLGDKYAGPMAKSLVAAKILGRPVRHFGGHNVRKQVLQLVAPAGAGYEAGRVRDTGSTDYTNTVSQSYAVLGLARTGGVPQRAVNYLIKQQCAKGYFRTFETAGRTCDASASSADVDATAFAVQALVAARRSGAAISDRGIVRAARWLISRQQRSGGFGGGSATRAANANSTGLASLALAATHHPKLRLMAARYVATLQITRPRAGSGPARRDLGAIAYNKVALSSALLDGVTQTTRDQFRRATAQGIFAFVPKPLSSLSVR